MTGSTPALEPDEEAMLSELTDEESPWHPDDPDYAPAPNSWAS